MRTTLKLAVLATVLYTLYGCANAPQNPAMALSGASEPYCSEVKTSTGRCSAWTFGPNGAQQAGFNRRAGPSFTPFSLR